MNEESSGSGRQFYLPIILTIITLILGIISFQTVFPDYPFLRNLYFTIQLFTIESGDRFYDRGVQGPGITFIFNLARYLAVATLLITIVLAILSVLRYKYFLSRVRFMKGHTILCGFGEVGEAFTRNFPDKKKLVIIEKDKSKENLARLEKEGVNIIEANALDVTVLERLGIENAKSLVALTGDDFDNLTIINCVLELLENKNQEENNIALSANLDSRNLKAAITEEWKKERSGHSSDLTESLTDIYETAKSIQSQGGFESAEKDVIVKFNRLKSKLLNYDPGADNSRSTKGEVRLFNINELAAKYIFRNYPPDFFRPVTDIDDPPLNVVFLGFSKVGEELLKLCIQNCHYINRKNTILTVISSDAEAIRARIKTVFRNTDKLIDFNFFEINPHHLTHKFLVEKGLSKIDVIYISSEEDQYQASYGSRARELFGNRVPVCRPFYKNQFWNEGDKPVNPFTFNILSKVCVINDIINESLDKKAMAVHNRWLKRAIVDYIKKLEMRIKSLETIPEPKPTILPWHMLNEEIRDDNRSVVDFISIKLRTVNQLPKYQAGEIVGKKELNFDFLGDEKKIEQLAEMEHRRWMATKFLNGWEPGPDRDPLAREHESLKEYELLDDGTKDFDRQQIKDIEDIISMADII
jgi:hypothetical protein